MWNRHLGKPAASSTLQRFILTIATSLSGHVRSAIHLPMHSMVTRVHRPSIDDSLISNDSRTEEICSDMADMFPSAEIIGTDLSPIQPQWVPPNCKFEIDDCTEEWTFQESSFDFIHVRALYGCIRDWPAFDREVFK